MQSRSLFSGPSLHMPRITHMWFVGLNDRLLCNCSVKRCRETQWEGLHVCDVTLAGTGVDKTDDLPAGITGALHLTLTYVLCIMHVFMYYGFHLF